MFLQLLSAFSRARSVPSKGWKVLVSKQFPRMYKGKGAAKAGVHKPRGGFRVLPQMLPRYVVPDLSGFILKPYVQNYPEQAVRRQGGGARNGTVAGASASGLQAEGGSSGGGAP